MTTEIKTVKEIRQALEEADQETLEKLMSFYASDPRAGVRSLVEAAKKKRLKLEKEKARIESMKVYEHQYEKLGLLCGIDEVGRGPLAGPVVACAMILPPDCDILYLNDSKKLTPSRREELCGLIKEKAVSYGLGFAGQERIDEINILNATYEAMREAVSRLSVKPAMLLNDAVTIPGIGLPQLPIIKGDEKSISIAAASIVAKVTRDAMMTELDACYPQYGFAENKGYGTRAHIDALKEYGPCPLHRRSFIAGILGESYGDGENNRQAGTRMEKEAAAFLQARGIVILEKNYRCKAGEIDIIARDGSTLVFLEVKARNTGACGSSLEAVDIRKRKRIIQAARYYLSETTGAELPQCRFDVIGFDGDEVRWIRDAFETRSF